MTELIKIPTFEGKQIRTIEHNGESWIPVNDLAEAWGTDRTTPYNIVVRNPDAFGGLSLDGDTVSQGFGLCINERGLYMLMGRISTARLKNKSARETVLRFQKWVPQLIQQYRRGELKKGVQLDTADPIKIANVQKKLAQTIHGDAHDLIVAAYLKHDLGYLTPHVPPHHIIMQKPVAGPAAPRIIAKSQTTLAPERPLIEQITGKDLAPRSPKPEGMLNATDIAERTGKGVHQINVHLLQFLKFIVPDIDNPNEYRITEAGKEYGREEPFTIAGRTVYRVFWFPKILERFK